MKHLTSIFLIALALVLVSFCASAGDDNHALSIQRLLINDDGSVSMIVHTTAEGEISASRFSLLVNGTAVPVNEIESYKRTSQGTTFLILSDISTLGATKGVKAIAAGIVDQMDSDDNAGLLVNGYTAEQIEVSDRILELKNQIEGDLFKRNANVKNLNETASVALSFLEQHNTVKERACLVILSSGENKNQSGITTEELRQQITDSGVTVYTVTFKAEKSTNQVNNFESLARASCGGVAVSIRYSPNDNDFVKALDSIQAQETQFRLITFTPGASAQAGCEISLNLQEGDFTLSDTVTMSAAQYAEYRKALAAQATHASEPDSSPSPTAYETAVPASPAPSEPASKPFPIAIVAGGGVFVLLLLILLLTKKKKPDVIADVPAELEEISEPEPIPEPIPEPEPISGPVPEPVVKLPLHVVLAEQTANGRHYEGDMDRTLLIGRDHHRVDIAINPDDTTISGIHLRLTYSNGTMTAQDVSRNGTSINNVKIKAPTILQQNTLLTLGRTSLRITWYPNQH